MQLQTLLLLVASTKAIGKSKTRDPQTAPMTNNNFNGRYSLWTNELFGVHGRE